MNTIPVDDLPNSAARKRKRKSRALPKGHRECDHQAAVIRWRDEMVSLNLRPEVYMLFAIPNGGLRNPIEARRLVGQGVRKGVSDLFLAFPAHGKAGLFLEMKAPDPADPINGTQGNDPSDEQQDWIDRASSVGYVAAVCWCAQDAIDVIESYIDGRPLRKS